MSFDTMFFILFGLVAVVIGLFTHDKECTVIGLIILLVLGANRYLDRRRDSDPRKGL
jgi:hypothetical protein